MPNKSDMRDIVRTKLDSIIRNVNAKLRGEGLASITPALTRLGRGGRIPHWFEGLAQTQSLPNMDGKTVGSVVEMLLVAALETDTFAKSGQKFNINPARGVDLPDLDLGVKSPSKNYCTSEPFFSAYERILGSEYDAVILLTDYQDAKKRNPLKLQIIQWRYLYKTQIADANLCKNAIANRQWLVDTNVSWAQKIFRFLSFVNQSDWRARKLIPAVLNMTKSDSVHAIVKEAELDFIRQNKNRAKGGKLPIPESDLEAIRRITTITPLHLGVIDAADNWVAENLKEFGRLPNSNEWQRYLVSPLDGEIGMSFALQWRYNFGKVFGVDVADDVDDSSDT